MIRNIFPSQLNETLKVIESLPLLSRNLVIALVLNDMKDHDFDTFDAVRVYNTYAAQLRLPVEQLPTICSAITLLETYVVITKTRKDKQYTAKVSILYC
jgi:hypothetical protein